MNAEDLRPLMEAVAEVVREYVDQRLSALPAPRDGAPGAPGKDADADLVRELVAAAFEALPPPKEGPPGPQGPAGETGPAGKDGERGADGERGHDGKDGAPGRDGADGKSVTIEDVRPILDAAAANWALEFERRAQERLEAAIAAIPKPKDGLDGLSIEDLEVEHDGDGTLIFRFARGEVKREFPVRLPRFRDKGVWREENESEYREGDGVSCGGSLWLAQRDAPEGRPDSGNGHWRLAVQRGRDFRPRDREPAGSGPVRTG